MSLCGYTTTGSKWLKADVTHKYIDIHWSQWCASKAFEGL